MKRKRLYIILSVFIFIAVLIVLSSEVFSLSSIEINYMSTTSNITATQEEIIQSAQIPQNKNVFMLSKQKYIDNIEQSNPYVRVVNIEIVFPNKIRIHIVERSELFAIKLSNGTFCIVDEYLKVLQTSNMFVNTNENAILLTNVEVDGTDYQVGNFLSVSSQNKKVIQNVYNSLYEWNISPISLKANISQITINDFSIGNVTLSMRTGATIKVYNVLELCSPKFNLAFSVYSYSLENMQSGTIVVTKVLEQDGTYKIKAFR